MKKLSFGVFLALGFFALARADEGALKSLAGMARAAPDPGPEADDAPTDAAPRMGTLKDAVADIPAPRAVADASAAAPSSPAPAAPSSSAPPAPPKKAAPPAAPSAAPAPRLWTRLYSTLLPSWRPATLSSSFETPLSTGPARVRATPLPALMPPPDSEAVRAGERRGMAELMSVSDPAAQ